MDEDQKQQMSQLFAELHALRILLNEALSVALSQEKDPDNAVVLARKDIEQIIELTEKKATSGPNAEFRKWHIERVRSLVSEQLDSIEKRVSRLKTDRAVH